MTLPVAGLGEHRLESSTCPPLKSTAKEASRTSQRRGNPVFVRNLRN